MSKTSTAAEKLMAERYGHRKSKSRNQRIFFTSLAAVLLTAFVVFAASVAIRGANEIKTQVDGFEIIDPQHAQVTFSATSPKPSQITCAIEVLNQSFAVVGYREVSLEAQANMPEKQQIFVNTTELGVSGVVDKCWFE
ncbi:MAG: DUF4307 domain-containing protein [Rhodoluna sp.]